MTASIIAESVSAIRGIQFWAVSFCRSTLSFYEAFANSLDVPFRVCVARSGLGARADIGFKQTEFDHIDLLETVDMASAVKALSERSEWLQVFGTYQTTRHIRATMKVALKADCLVGVASEAPCNMEPPGHRRLAKAAYLRYVLPRRVAAVTSGARFILNWSGDDAASLVALGWPPDKIMPVGYFPPPLLGSVFTMRDKSYLDDPVILCTGSTTWHRGPDVLMKALGMLQAWGIRFRAAFTGSGPLDGQLRSLAADTGLDCVFLGSVPLPELINLYQSCTLFVAPGRKEPWGMRVNDALNCGAPSIVSRGMGASKLVLEHGLGSTFRAGESVDLAWQIRALLEDPARYQKVCDNSEQSHTAILPNAAAQRLATRLRSEFPEWQAGIKL